MKMTQLRNQKRTVAGMALIAVLWMVAALSVIVLGVSSAVKSEVRTVSKYRHAIESRALGEAAIYMVLRKIAAEPVYKSRLSIISTVFEGLEIPVEIVPASGRIDLNTAPAALLSALLTVSGGLPNEAAERIAANIVATRSPKQNSSGKAGFETVEELLQVSEMTFPLYARLVALVTVDQRGSGLVNPMAAPIGVLQVLAQGNLPLAEEIASKRNAGQVGIDTTGLGAGFIDSSVAERFQLTARVPLSDQRYSLILRDVEFGFGASRGIPWRVLKSEQRFE